MSPHSEIPATAKVGSSVPSMSGEAVSTAQYLVFGASGKPGWTRSSKVLLSPSRLSEGTAISVNDDAAAGSPALSSWSAQLRASASVSILIPNRSPLSEYPEGFPPVVNACATFTVSGCCKK